MNWNRDDTSTCTGIDGGECCIVVNRKSRATRMHGQGPLGGWAM